MNRATRLNPSGLRGYDRSDYRTIPAYRHAAEAIGELQRALRDVSPDMPVNDFHHLLVDLTAGRRILDRCPECPAGPRLPYRVEYDDRGATGHYECSCGHEWSCGWGLTNRYEIGEIAA